jgi:hypothetical protein
MLYLLQSVRRQKHLRLPFQHPLVLRQREYELLWPERPHVPGRQERAALPHHTQDDLQQQEAIRRNAIIQG